MSRNVFVCSSVTESAAAASTGSAAYGLSSVVCVSGLVMYLTNFSAPSLFFVFLKIERLMPAGKLAICSPPLGAGSGTTPNSSDFMPSDSIVVFALFWLRIIAAFLFAKSATDWFALSYCAFDGFAALVSCIRSM